MIKPADSTVEFQYRKRMFFKTKPANPYRLLTPGPVPLHPEVQKVLSLPMIHHRTPEFEHCLKSVAEKLKSAFSTSQPVFMHVSTGSGAMESALTNTLSAGDEVLCIVSGKFGERWAEMAKVYGLKVHQLSVAWGEAVQIQHVAETLEANPQIKAVLTQACETSTATIHPIRELGALIQKRPQTIFMVDAITAVGAMPLETEEWGLDVVVGGSQKAFMLPTGLSFITLSAKAWRFNEVAKLPRFYWDLRSERKSILKGETFFSSAVPLVRALDVALDFLSGSRKLETLNRIHSLAVATREAAPHLGLHVFSKSPSPSVTALTVPAGLDSQKLRDHLEKEHNITLMGGQDQLKGKILRIGHLGYITNADMQGLFEAVYKSLVSFGQSGLKPQNLQSAHAALKKHLTSDAP